MRYSEARQNEDRTSVGSENSGSVMIEHNNQIPNDAQGETSSRSSNNSENVIFERSDNNLNAENVVPERNNNLSDDRSENVERSDNNLNEPINNDVSEEINARETSEEYHENIELDEIRTITPTEESQP